MCFPIQFAKSRGQSDFFSPVINFIGNALVVAVAGISLGFISNIALKRLGFNHASSTFTAISTTIGKIGIAAAIGGFCVFVALCIAIVRAFKLHF